MVAHLEEYSGSRRKVALTFESENAEALNDLEFLEFAQNLVKQIEPKCTFLIKENEIWPADYEIGLQQDWTVLAQKWDLNPLMSVRHALGKLSEKLDSTIEITKIEYDRISS